MSSGHVWSDGELAQMRLEALEHLNRLRSGAATERDELEFLAWRRRSPAHREAMRAALVLEQAVRAVEGQSVPAPVVRKEVSSTPVLPFKRVGRAPVGRRVFLGGAIAASAGALTFVGRSLEMIPSLAEWAADYRTGPGERRLVALAGGATIDLNTRTSIAMRSTAGIATIELIGGEAIVTSGAGAAGRAVLVAGAGSSSAGNHSRFSVRRDGDEVCVACLAGQVDVTWRQDLRRLRTRQQLRYDDERIAAPVDADPRLLTAWQSGTLIFRAMPMRAVVDEINRYRPGRVILSNRRLADRPLTGTYYIARLDEFFHQAQLAFGVEVTRLPGGIVVLT